MFGGANSGTDENGDPNKDVAKFNGRLTSVDLDGDGSISDAECRLQYCSKWLLFVTGSRTQWCLYSNNSFWLYDYGR